MMTALGGTLHGVLLGVGLLVGVLEGVMDAVGVKVGEAEGVLVGVGVSVGVGVLVGVSEAVGVLEGVAEGRTISGGRPMTRATRYCSRIPERSECSVTEGMKPESKGMIIGFSKVTPTITRATPSSGLPASSCGRQRESWPVTVSESRSSGSHTLPVRVEHTEMWKYPG